MQISKDTSWASSIDLARFSFNNPATVLDIVAQVYYLPNELHPLSQHGQAPKFSEIDEHGVCSLEDLQVRLRILASRRNIDFALLEIAPLEIIKEYVSALTDSVIGCRSVQELRTSERDAVCQTCFDAIDFFYKERQLRCSRLSKSAASVDNSSFTAGSDWWKA